MQKQKVTLEFVVKSNQVNALTDLAKNLSILGEYSLNFKVEEVFQPQRYISLPGEFCTPKNYNGIHPDISFADSRLAVSPEVLKAAKELKLQVSNNDQGFIGNLTFDQTEKLYNKLKTQGLFFLSPWYFNRALNRLNEGIRGRREVKYEDGEPVTKERLIEIKSDIMEIRDPWRAIWLWARFLSENGKLTIAHPIVQKNEEIKIVTEDLDKDTLMVDKIQGIDLRDWVSNGYTSQGLVKNTIKEGRDSSWYPRNGHVPRFNADSGGVGFLCGGGPSDSGSSLGIWPARIFHRKRRLKK